MKPENLSSYQICFFVVVLPAICCAYMAASTDTSAIYYGKFFLFSPFCFIRLEWRRRNKNITFLCTSFETFWDFFEGHVSYGLRYPINFEGGSNKWLFIFDVAIIDIIQTKRGELTFDSSSFFLFFLQVSRRKSAPVAARRSSCWWAAGGRRWAATWRACATTARAAIQSPTTTRKNWKKIRMLVASAMSAQMETSTSITNTTENSKNISRKTNEKFEINGICLRLNEWQTQVCWY